MALCVTPAACGRIVDALGLEHVRSLRLSMEVGSVVMVVAEQYVHGDQLDRLAYELETNEYVLVPKVEHDIDTGKVGFISRSSLEAVAQPRHPTLPAAYAPTALSNWTRGK